MIQSWTKKLPSLKGRCWKQTTQRTISNRKCRKTKRPCFEHCALAIDRSLTAGQHGLPLMGSGDWNDGMNRVGVEGKRRKCLAGLVSLHSD